MSRFIRWQGLIGFVAIIALIAAFVYVFAGSLAKSALVKGSEQAFGAEVNIADVDVNFIPLAITINEMQVTDKTQPSHNVFAFSKATASVDVWQYLFGKINVEQLDVVDLSFAELRTKPGKVYQQVDAEQEQEDSLKSLLPEFDLQLPDSKTLLENSNLHTVKSAQALQVTYKEEQQKLKALKADLPSKESLKQYQAEVKALGKVKVKSLEDLQKVKADFDKIKAKFAKDKAVVDNAKEALLASKSKITQQLNDLKAAPAKDWQEIEQKYQLDNIGAEDFAHILFGEQARDYIEKFNSIYPLIEPMISGDSTNEEVIAEKSKATGRFVYFQDETPLPSFLLKRAHIKVNLPQGEFSIQANEITHQHWYRNLPSRIDISSAVKGQVAASSQFSVAKSGQFTSKGNWQVNDFAVKDSEISQSKALALTLDKGMLSGSGDYSLVDSQLGASAKLALAQAQYSGEASTKFTNIVFDTIKSLDVLEFALTAMGPVTEPELSVSSSLDKALSGAFKQQVANKLAEFKGSINAGLNDKVSQSITSNGEQAAELVDFEALLIDTDNALEQLQNSDVVKQQQEKLEDKARDKLKKKLGKLFG